MQRCFVSYALVLILVITCFNFFLRYKITSKRNVVEEFSKEESMLKELQERVTNQEKEIIKLKTNAEHFVDKSNDAQVKNKKPKKTLADLTTYDLSFGMSYLNVKNHSMDNTKIVEQLLRDLGVEPSKESDKELKDHQNYCLYRKVTNQCKIGRKDCKDVCNSAKSKSRIWG